MQCTFFVPEVRRETHLRTQAEHAARYGCPSISVQTACGTGDLCITPDDPDGYTFTCIWLDKQKQKRDLLQLDVEDAWQYLCG